jgi:lipopolysaccharide transport system permease protein
MEGTLATHFSYFTRIWSLRYFWFSLVRNDLNNRYKRSFFGIGWSLLRPLAMTCILCVVFGKLFHVALEDYAPFLLIGLTTWQFFSETLLQGCFSFTAGAAYIRQQQVPLAIFPLRTVLGSGFHGLVALVMSIAVAAFFKGFPDPLALLNLLPAVVYLFLLGWALAILGGVMYTHFPDTNNIIEITLQILYYLTPVMYNPASLESRGRLKLLVEWNPLTSILALVRTPILEGTPPALHHIEISLVFLVVVAAAAAFLMRKMERTLIFWI